MTPGHQYIFVALMDFCTFIGTLSSPFFKKLSLSFHLAAYAQDVQGARQLVPTVWL